MHPSGDSVDAMAHDAAALADQMRALVASGRRAEALSLYARARDRLWETEGREPTAELRALQAELLAEAVRAVPRPREASSTTSPGIRPLPPESSTSYVGRSGLTDSVVSLLADAKVVTLHGPGGVGKTRIALNVAHRLASAGQAAVAWVDLAPARDPEGALYAAADAIGVRDIALDDPVGSLVRALGEEATVVVVDNCEHLLDVAAHLVDGLQARSPRTTVLATSREPLEVDGEHVVPVPALTASDDDPDSPALRLFDDRLATARGYGLEPSEIHDAVAVTQRLDGLPLALELAAGRGAALGIAQLRERVGLDLLDRGRRTGSTRHRSLRAVVDWSYALLGHAEQRLFARLSVFTGSFSLARAEVVCADDRVPVARLPSLLSDLVDRSLVTTVRSDEQTRHRLLQPLREYAAERLESTGEAQRWQTAHARHMADVAAARAQAMHGPGEPGATEQLVEDLDESRVALEHAQSAGDIDTAMRLANAMHDLGSRQMRLELLGWADSVAKMPDASDHPLYAAVLGTAAKGRWVRTDLEGAIARAQRALDAVPDPSDARRVRALLAMAEVNLVAGELDTAVAFYRRAVDLDAAPGPSTDAEGGLAMTLADLGRVDEGVELADRALARAEASGAPSHLAWAWYAQGRCWALVDPAKAATMLERSAELSRSVANHSNEYSALTRLLVVRAQLTPPVDLLPEYRATLQRWRRTGSTTFLSVTLRNLAGAVGAVGSHGRGRGVAQFRRCGLVRTGRRCPARRGIRRGDGGDRPARGRHRLADGRPAAAREQPAPHRGLPARRRCLDGRPRCDRSPCRRQQGHAGSRGADLPTRHRGALPRPGWCRGNVACFDRRRAGGSACRPRGGGGCPGPSCVRAPHPRAAGPARRAAGPSRRRAVAARNGLPGRRAGGRIRARQAAAPGRRPGREGAQRGDLADPACHPPD